MKNLKTFKTTIITLAFLFASLIGVANGNPVLKKRTPENTIATFFKFPKLLIPYLETHKQNNVKVEVVFITDKDGKVTYADAKTQDQQLKAEIEKQFSTLKITQVKENTAHSVVLSFKIR